MDKIQTKLTLRPETIRALRHFAGDANGSISELIEKWVERELKAEPDIAKRLKKKS